jgi:hypothetical protein
LLGVLGALGVDVGGGPAALASARPDSISTPCCSWATMPTSSEGALARDGIVAAGVAAVMPAPSDIVVSSSGGAVASIWSSPIVARLSARLWASAAAAFASNAARSRSALALASPFIVSSGAGPTSVETLLAAVGIWSTELAIWRLSSSDILVPWVLWPFTSS